MTRLALIAAALLATLHRALASRWVQFTLLPFFIIIWFLATDPSHGQDTLLRLQLWAQAVLITGVAYLVSKSLAGQVSGESMASNAAKGNTAAGIAFAGLCLLRGLVLLGLLLFFAVGSRAQPIPAAAQQHLPTLRAQIEQVWPTMPTPAYFGALIEHESCITLRHPRCWSATSRLKTAREEGAGLGQLTRAWRADGSERFDALAATRQLDPAGLQQLNWANVYQRPDLQLRAIVLSTRATYHRLQPLVPTHMARLAMTDAAYNGGLQGLLNERRACAAKPGCDANKWFANVETTCLKSHQALYAGRSACSINRHHVADVLQTRMPRYQAALPAPTA